MLITVTPSPSSPSFSVVTLNIEAQAEDYAGLFDSIEVWRSRGSESGPYEELTGVRWSGARLPHAGGELPSIQPNGPNVNVAGLKLEVLLNEQDKVSTTFTGADPLTLLQAAAQIQSQSLGRLRAWVDSSVQLVIETAEPGTAATLRILPSDAASFLGLPLDGPEAFAYGREARLTLTPGQSSYIFHDKSGASAYTYRTRFRNRMENTVSEFSEPSSVNHPIAVDPEAIVVGYLDLIDSEGRVLPGIEVSLRTPFVGQLVAGKLVAGQDLSKKTDEQGHVEFALVRGQVYTLSIAGTNISKEIKTPMDLSISSFLLVADEFSTQDDYFRARVPQIPAAERRSF